MRFENFNTINGPDLRVYLSSGLGIDDSVELGKLKATRGSFNYELDPSIKIGKYDKVLVWCEPFRVLFSHAQVR